MPRSLQEIGLSQTGSVNLKWSSLILYNCDFLWYVERLMVETQESRRGLERRRLFSYRGKLEGEQSHSIL